MKARVNWRVRSAPRPGVGVGLLGFCVWVIAACLWACWVAAKWTVVAVVTLGVAVWGLFDRAGDGRDPTTRG